MANVDFSLIKDFSKKEEESVNHKIKISNLSTDEIKAISDAMERRMDQLCKLPTEQFLSPEISAEVCEINSMMLKLAKEILRRNED